MILTSYGMQASSPGPGPGQYFAFVTGNGGTVESLGCTKDASALLKSANFLVIPSGYGPARIYPETPLDFNGYFPFTRASTATFTGQDRLIQRTGSSYNLYTYSEEFDNAVWNKAGVTITPNLISAPDGSMTGDRVRITSSSGTIRVRRTTTATGSPGDQFVFSTYVSRGSTGETGCSYLIGNSTLSSFSTGSFDLTTLTFTGATGSWLTGRSYESAPNGWFKLIFNAIIPTGENTLLTSVTPGLVTISTLAEVGKFNYLWGSQLTSGSEVLPYQYVKESTLAFPRLDYSFEDCPAILLEPTRTNSCTASEDFSNAYYNLNVSGTGAVLVQTDQIIAPGGTLTADKLIAGITGTSHAIRTSANGYTGVITTISVFAKAGELSRFRLGINSGPTGGVDINLATGTITSVFGPGTTGTIRPVDGEGWYRCSVTGIIGANVDLALEDVTGSTGFTGNGTDGLYLWGFQMETRGATAVGLYPTSYIPTSGTAVTRAVDALQLPNATTAGFVGASGGTMLIYFKNNIPYTRDGSIYFGIGDTSALNPGTGIRLVNPTGTTRLQVTKIVGGASTVLFSSATNDFKMVVTWGGSNLDLFVNGQKIALDSGQRSFPVPLPLNFFGTPITGTLLPFYIQDMALFNPTLSDAQCIELSSL
jgi:hypothetical protein